MDALDGSSVGLPNPTAIIPYIGLFTLVTLDPTTTARHMMTTPYLPGLSIIRNNKFKEAPANTSATAKNVARIFDSLDIQEDTFNFGRVPLVPGVAAFKEKRYWRIPVFAGAIFAALMPQLPNDLSKCKDIVLARRIVAHLELNSSGGGGRGRGGGPSGGRGSSGRGGGGSREGGRRQSKRKNAGGEGSPSAEKGKMKARRVAGRDGAGDSGECSDASGEALCSFPVPLGPYWNVEFPPGVRSQYGQSGRLEIASSTRTLGDDTPAIDTNKDSSDSETGCSEHS